MVALVLFLKGSYRAGFALLLLPAVLCLAMVVVARLRFPHPQELEQKVAQPLQTGGFSPAYWLYVAGGALIAAGFADFSLIAFHFQQAGTVSAALIPVWYAVAMATGARAALDPDFEQVIRARDERRRNGLRVLVGRLAEQVGRPSQEAVEETVDILCTLSSFECFDALAGPSRSMEAVTPVVQRLARAALASERYAGER